MKFKIIVLITLVFGIVFGQKITDTTNVASETYDKFEQSLNAVKSDVRKLNKRVSALDSLLKTNQSFNIERFGRIEKSNTDQSTIFDDEVKNIHSTIEQIKGEINNSIVRLEKKINQNLSNSNSRIENLQNIILTLSDSLLTTKNNILKFQEEISYGKAFEKARLELGPDQEFEWKGKRFSTNYSGEKSRVIENIENLKMDLEEKSMVLDSAINKANSQIDTLDNYIKKVKEDNKNQISSLDKTIAKTISDRTLYWIIAILILLLILVAVFFFLRSKVSEQQDSLSSVKDTQEKLENEAIQLDTKLIHILEQKLEVAQQQPQQTKEVDHSLPIKLSEEIHRMRKRLITMPDECEREKKVLSRRLESLEEKLNDMGYEIVNLEGKAYDERMTLNVLNIVESKELKQDENNISRVIKPQVKFKGEIIQPGDIEVTQGIN